MKPKVIPAHDPTRLNSKPPKIGPDVFLASARLNEGKGDMKSAYEQYGRALEADPRNKKVLLSFARFQQRRGHHEDAVRTYKRLLVIDPHDALSLNDLGLCYSNQGQVDEAIKVMSRAIELQPANPRYRNNIASILVKTGMVNEALAQMYDVHEPAVANYNVGYLLHQNGQHHEASQYFAKAVEINPRLNDAHEMLRISTIEQRSIATQRHINPTPAVRRIDYDELISDRGDARTSLVQTPIITRRSGGTGIAFAAPQPPPEPEFLVRAPRLIGPFGFRRIGEGDDFDERATAQAADAQLRLPSGIFRAQPKEQLSPPTPDSLQIGGTDRVPHPMPLPPVD